MEVDQKHMAYWHRNLVVTGVLLVIWFAVTFVVPFYARELNSFVILGFPLGFYMGAQGSLLVYLAIIGFYARHMNKLDREFGLNEGEDE